MAFPVSARTTGELVTAAMWNADLKDNLNALYGGALALASQAALDLVYASSATQLARLAKGAALQHLRMNSGATALEWADATQYMTLLKANSGTTTNAGAENVDTIAMASGLTAKDSLLTMLALESVDQATATIALYNSTDSVNLQSITASLGAGAKVAVFMMSHQSQSAATTVATAMQNTFTAATFTTAWTGAWTLALRHGGVTAGGTFKWSWAVYKLAGQ